MAGVCKKIVITGLVLVGAYMLIGNTWVGSHLRLWARQASERVRRSVKPEREVERLRMEITGLKSQDERLIDKVARQSVQADRLEAAASEQRKDLAKRETGLKAMHAALATKDTLISLHGEKFPRAEVEKQLRADFEAFEKEEEYLKSREEHLAELKRGLALNKAKLAALRLQREKMLTEVQRLETALAEERRERALQDSVIDDAPHRKVLADLEAVKDRVEAMRKARVLRGEQAGTPIKEAEMRKEQQDRLDARLKQRLGDGE